jgi:hypothetical protein
MALITTYRLFPQTTILISAITYRIQSISKMLGQISRVISSQQKQRSNRKTRKKT